MDFGPEERAKNVTISLRPDTVPEAAEAYLFEVYEGVNGATIDTGSSKKGITILSNDNYMGVFEFEECKSCWTTKEEAGQMHIPVARTFGAFGNVTVAFSMRTASAGGGDFRDYSGTLLFTEGMRSQDIVVDIYDNRHPDKPKDFFVTLDSIDEEGTLGGRREVQAIIEASDDAYGVVEFVAISTPNITLEEPSSGTTAVSLELYRSEGIYDDIAIRWAITQDGVPASDFKAQTGLVSFKEGERKASFVIEVAADAIPELEEIFALTLSPFSGGARVGGRDSTAVVVPANDDPHGVVRFNTVHGSSIVANESSGFG